MVNTVMDHGQKDCAQRIVYGAFDEIAAKNPKFQSAGDFAAGGGHAKPRLGGQAPPRGGATYQVPVEVPVTGSCRWRCGGWLNFADGRKGWRCSRPWRPEIMDRLSGAGERHPQT